MGMLPFPENKMAEQKENKTIRWVKLGLTFFAFVAVSIGFGFLIQFLFTNFKIPLDVPIWLALLIIFTVLFLVNLSLFIPLPFGVSIMLVAAAHWNPVLVALAGALGGGLGELSGYYFGYLGKKVAINENTPTYKTVHRWIQKYGMWAIAFLAFQPIIPFEIGGFIAGVARMPVSKFLPAIWIGKFPKYLFLIYLGSSIFQFFFHRGI
jgi:membrane protein YqaA with SNARE-associated domain